MNLREEIQIGQHEANKIIEQLKQLEATLSTTAKETLVEEILSQIHIIFPPF